MSERLASVRRLGLPYLVAELHGDVVGYAFAGSYRPRTGYRYTVEDSVYVATRHHRAGIGRALLTELIPRCESGPWRQMIAVIGDRENTGSIALHQRFGFHHVGRFESIGFKFGRWLDSVLMQRTLGRGADILPGELAVPGSTPG